MSLVNKLKTLKTNIFGSSSKSNTSFTRAPASYVDSIAFQQTPTGVLGTDPLGFQTFSYPLDTQINYENGHYMLFYVNVQDKTKYTYTGGASEGNRMTVNQALKGANESEVRYTKLRDIKRKVYNTDKAEGAGQGDSTIVEKRNIYSPAHDLYYDTFVTTTAKGKNKLGVSASNFNNTRRITDSVSIYLPPNVEESTSAKYDESATGIAGFLVSAFGKSLEGMDAQQLTRKVAGGLEGISKDMTFRAIGLAGELVGAEGVEALAKKAFGEASNPYMEVLFDQMQLRTFTYNFNFAPRNEQEALEVQKIIQLFRFHMAPELRPDVNRYVGLPSQFDIHYMYLSKEGVASENNYYNRIATCVLQDCKINYTPNGVKSFEDGGPVQTTMTLTFKEIELLTKDKIAQGY